MRGTRNPRNNNDVRWNHNSNNNMRWNNNNTRENENNNNMRWNNNNNTRENENNMRESNDTNNMRRNHSDDNDNMALAVKLEAVEKEIEAIKADKEVQKTSTDQLKATLQQLLVALSANVMPPQPPQVVGFSSSTLPLTDPSNKNFSFIIAPERLNLSSRTFTLLEKEETRYKPTTTIPFMYENLQSSDESTIKVVCYCNGLFCLASDVFWRSIFTYNAATKECMKLPELLVDELARLYRDYFLGFDETSKKYKLVHIYLREHEYGNYSDCHYRDDHGWGDIITLGDPSWRKLHVPDDIDNDMVKNEGGYSTDSAFFNGAFHWLITDRFNDEIPEHILTMDIHNEQFRVINLPISSKKMECSIVSMGASLALIGTGGNTRCIWKLVDSDMGIWTQQYTCDMSLLYEYYPWQSFRIEFIDMLREHKFLMAVHGTHNNDMDLLVIYDARKEEYNNIINIKFVYGNDLPMVVFPFRLS